MNNKELQRLVSQAFLALQEKRLFEAQELFEQVLPHITIPAKKGAVLYQLGVLNRSLLGNGLEARRYFMATVQTLKTDATQTRDSRTTYAWVCENLMLLSLSYDEYASWAEALRELQPNEAILREQYPSVQDDRQKGLPWSDVLTRIARGYYNRDPAEVDPGLYGEAAATYHVILANRREFRLDREAWAQAVIEHVVLCIRLGNDTLNFAVKHRPLLNPLPYLAIGAEAQGFIEEYLESNPADARVIGMQTHLCSWRESLEEGARKLDDFNARSVAPSTDDAENGAQGSRIRCIIAGALIGVILSCFGFALLARFFVGGGSMTADVPPELRSLLVVTFLLWAIIPGAGWGLLAGSIMPVNLRVGPLAFFTGAMSSLCGVCGAWTSQWVHVRQLHSGQIVMAVLISVGILLVIVPMVTMTVGLKVERLIRGT